jgi:Transglycosylase
VEAAAQAYFSTRGERLTLTQAALLAGMIQAPSSYDPFRRPRTARARRAEVLDRMERNGHLPEVARARAAAAPLGLRPGHPAGGGGGGGSPDRPEVPRAPWFVGWVLDQLLDPADHRFDALGTSRRARTERCSRTRAGGARGPRAAGGRRPPAALGAGLDAEVLAGCDADPARAAEPGRVWRSGPAPGAQAPTGTRVRLWANPPGCPPLTTITTRPGPSTTSRAERWRPRMGRRPRKAVTAPMGSVRVARATGVRARRPPGRA